MLVLAEQSVCSHFCSSHLRGVGCRKRARTMRALRCGRAVPTAARTRTRRDKPLEVEGQAEKRVVVVVVEEEQAKKIQKAIREFLRKKHEKVVIPQNFKCPITMDLFRNPVVTSDGHTYEYGEILKVINTTMRSPMTGQTLPNKNIVPNLNLRSEVMEFRQQNKFHVPTELPVIRQEVSTSPSGFAPTQLAPRRARTAPTLRTPAAPCLSFLDHLSALTVGSCAIESDTSSDCS